MKKIGLIIILVGLVQISSAQFNNTFKKLYDIGDAYIYEENYIDALPVFLKLDSMAANNANIQFNLGLCYLNSYNQKDKASYYLEKASQSISSDYYGNFNETSAPVFTYYFLGKAYFLEQQFDLALQNFEKFKYYLTSEDMELQKDVEHYIEMTLNAKKLIANPITIRRENLGDVVNSIFPDYAPVMSPDQKFFIFTSRREGSTGNKHDEKGKYYEDLYIADYNASTGKFSNLRPLPGNVNTAGHEASISISWDGQNLFIYKDDKGDGNIYMSTMVDGNWSAAEKLGPEINTKYYENHACLSPDGESLFFVSNRPGGQGGKDIWVSKRIGANKWSKAENMGSRINSEFDEDSPVILSDGRTLYFSSKGHETMGGYDIFYTIFENGDWSFPRNIGYPLNTVNDDVFFIPTLDGKEAYYASALPEGQGDLDLYRILITGDINQIAILNGLIRDTVTDQAIKANVTVYDFNTGEIYSQTNADEGTGEYSVSLESGRKYKVVVTTENGMTAEDVYDIPSSDFATLTFNKPYYFGNALITMAPDTILNRINVGQRMGDRFVLRNVYFDFDKSTLRPESKTELDRLVALLNALPDISIELSGHTDNRGSDSYNKKLSEDRALAVVNYLVDAGIKRDRLTYKGYGFDQPIASNETDAGRQLNRRTEFRIIGTGGQVINIDSNLVNINLVDTGNTQNNPNNSDVLVEYSPKWYVIGGSFMFLKNAEKFRDELKAEGYSDAEIIGQTSTGSYRVSYKSFKDKESANKEIVKLKQQTKNEGLWLLQK